MFCHVTDRAAERSTPSKSLYFHRGSNTKNKKRVGKDYAKSQGSLRDPVKIGSGKGPRSQHAGSSIDFNSTEGEKKSRQS